MKPCAKTLGMAALGMLALGFVTIAWAYQTITGQPRTGSAR